MLARTSLLLSLALCALASLAVAASADAPVEGLWKLGSDATIEFKQTSAGHFGGTVRGSDGKVSCPGNVNGVQVTGSDTHYTGTNRFYLQGSCDFFGAGNVDITLGDDGLSGQYVGEPPPGASCCTQTLVMTRDNTATQPDLPAIVNAILVGLQKRYHELVKTKGSKKRKSRLKALGGAGRSGRSRVSAYKAGANEQKLKTCAVGALKTVENGARIKTERAGKGLSALAKCLKGFANDLPNGRPGTAAPPAAQPGGPVLDGSYAGQNGAGAKAGNFSFESRGAQVGNFAFSMWFPSVCNGRRGDGFASFSTPQKRPVDANGRFTYTLDNGVLGITITGLVSGGKSSGTVSVTDHQDSRCSTGTVRWTAARR